MNTAAALARSDLEIFGRLGIGPELVNAAGVCRVTDTEAREVWGFQLARGADLSGILFPYFDPLTHHRVTARLRRDRPEVDASGNSSGKYLSPYGDNRHIYFPPGAGELLGDTGVPVTLVESEKSALAITAMAARNKRRILSVATGGCWSWRGKVGITTDANGGRKEERGPLPDLSRITWGEGRPTIIAFDSNSNSNSEVRRARWALAEILAGFGARVLFADLPAQGGANGPDDLIGIVGDDALLAILDAARPFAEQAEKEAEQAVARLSKSVDLEGREQVIEIVARVADLEHRRVLAGRAAKGLGERKDAIEREVGVRAAHWQTRRDQAWELARQGRLLRLDVNPPTLLMEVEEFYAQRRHLPEGAALVEALFCMNTYTFDVFDTTPYIAYESAVPGCGKTASLERHEAVCARPYLGADPSAAALFRRIDRDRPTWLLDEAAVLQGDWEKAREVSAIVDVGYKRGATVSRCEGQNHTLRDFQVYCPKVLAKIGGGFKATTFDRSIAIHLEKAPLRAVRRNLLARWAAPLKERLEAYALQYSGRLEALYEQEPDVGYWPVLTGREDELWGPLLMHAKLAGPETESRALKVALEFSKNKAEIALSEDRDLALAQELLEVLGMRQGARFSPRELLMTLLGLEAWGEALAERKSAQAKVCVIGGFLTRFRLASRRREKRGTTYDRAEAIEAIRRHTPQTNDANYTNATKPVNKRLSEVPIGESGCATGPQVATSPDRGGPPEEVVETPGGISQDRNDTQEALINAGQMAFGNSNPGGGRDVLAALRKAEVEAEIQGVDLDKLEDVL